MFKIIIIKDGVKYTEWEPQNETNDFEPMIKHHAKDIFGHKTLYFDIKKRIETIIGEKTIPDGYLIDLDKKEFYIIEAELSTHPRYGHINEQISRFISALNNYQTRQKLAKILKEHVQQDIIKEKKVKEAIDDKEEIYEFFLNILEKVKDQKYSIVVLIDEKTDKIVDACQVLHPRPNIKEFKTFFREGVDPKKVHIHLFEPLYEPKKPVIKMENELKEKPIERNIEDVKVRSKLPSKRGVKRFDWDGKDKWLYEEIKSIYIKTLEDVLRETAHGVYPTLRKRIKKETGIELTQGTVAGLLYTGKLYDKEGIHRIGWWKKNGGLEAFLNAKEKWKRKGWI